uniref:Sulfotransferase n=1 Tax=Nicotiana sylvestris TaxID=4096 RepID=A0A1U7YDU2_NICSY|nr:PREDICTED: cytosolic sulfotransferase 8-like [Nicotiana sylvestris]
MDSSESLEELLMMNSEESLDEFLQSIPKVHRWGNNDLVKLNGVGIDPKYVPNAVRALNDFKPLPNDVILASFPKTGTTWLKSLLFSITYRSFKESLANIHPHVLVPTIEVQGFEGFESSTHDSRRLYATHTPYQILGSTHDLSNCRIIYITRNPKDTLISMWHFTNKMKDADGSLPLEEAIENFCSEIIPCGPYYDHVMGFKTASLEKPEYIFFITYEELMEDTKTHVKRLAEFLGCPFDKEEEVEEVVKNCSFDILTSHEVNKSGDFTSWFPVPFSSYFRQSNIGDHKSYLDAKTIEHIDALTKEKFHGAGFMYGI